MVKILSEDLALQLEHDILPVLIGEDENEVQNKLMELCMPHDIDFETIQDFYENWHMIYYSHFLD